MTLTPILAEASNSQVGTWVAGANAVFTLFLTLLILLKFTRNDAEKRDVTISPDTATKQEFNAHVQRNAEEHDGLHSRVGGSERGTREMIDKKITELRHEQAEAIHNLNAEVVELAKQVGEISAHTESQNQRLLLMDSKLDRLIERRNS